MKISKFFSIALLLFSFVFLTKDFGFADNAQTSGSFWNASNYSSLVNNLMNNVDIGIQNIQDKLADLFLAQDRSKQIAADTREKEQEALESQQAKQRDQESQMQELKDRQETQKQQQEDLMQDRSDRR